MLFSDTDGGRAGRGIIRIRTRTSRTQLPSQAFSRKCQDARLFREQLLMQSPSRHAPDRLPILRVAD